MEDWDNMELLKSSKDMVEKLREKLKSTHLLQTTKMLYYLSKVLKEDLCLGLPESNGYMCVEENGGLNQQTMLAIVLAMNALYFLEN
ncbi:hypothetical protein C5167_026475 [Papaver somniferum]|nr:hypothetical protein C5167_026475 [Papaver somniferum]